MSDLYVQFTQGSSFQLEGITAAIGVSRANSSTYTGSFSVQYSCIPINATSNVDFESVSGTLNFSNNQDINFINVPIYSDSSTEPFESFIIVLNNLSSAATNNTITTNNHAVYIIDGPNVEPTPTPTPTPSPTASPSETPPTSPSPTPTPSPSASPSETPPTSPSPTPTPSPSASPSETPPTSPSPTPTPSPSASPSETPPTSPSPTPTPSPSASPSETPPTSPSPTPTPSPTKTPSKTYIPIVFPTPTPEPIDAPDCWCPPIDGICPPRPVDTPTQTNTTTATKAPELLILPPHAPDFVISNGVCYKKTDEVIEGNVTNNYYGDFQDCQNCWNNFSKNIDSLLYKNRSNLEISPDLDSSLIYQKYQLFSEVSLSTNQIPFNKINGYFSLSKNYTINLTSEGLLVESLKFDNESFEIKIPFKKDKVYNLTFNYGNSSKQINKNIYFSQPNQSFGLGVI